MEEKICAFCGKPIEGKAFRERALVARFKPALFHHHCGKKYFELTWRTHFQWYGLSQEDIPDFYRYIDESLKVAFEEVML
ncbi:MAG: hypothetical protein PWP60_171 [Candidatus Atribacteria bacterium]|jgi:hypothetical protein|nr:hypothetical protein [Candidatus Atribacteria bacterium]MDI3530322.1 hypothetical protein [Candidatus Atribacteria bacterium]